MNMARRVRLARRLRREYPHTSWRRCWIDASMINRFACQIIRQERADRELFADQVRAAIQSLPVAS